jgi:outer membrane beta-barrel protein
MRLRRAITILLAALPMVGAPQGLEGLDFSAPRKKPEAPLPPPSEDDELPPLPEAKPAPARKAEAKAAEKQEAKDGGQADLLALPEGDVALGDRVKAVQRKGFIKRHRFEIAPLFAATVNDAFYQKIGGGLRLAYHLGDTFAVATRFTAYDLQASLGPLDIKLRPLRTDNIREGQIAFQSMLLSSQPSRQAMLEGIWSPIYGKAAWLDNRIIHFDLYLTAGVGLVWSSTSFGSVGKEGQGPHVAADVGGGLRFYPLEWLALEAGLLLTVYPDQPVESVPGTVQKILTANIGVSFFLPPSFEYFYP